MKTTLGWNRDVALLLLAALAIGVAWFNPRWPGVENRVNALFIVDITQSMNVADTRLGDEDLPRIEFARRIIAQLLAEIPCGSRVGLGIFNEYRTYVLLNPMEVCANFSELESTLGRVSNRMSWAGASEIAKGIHFGLKAVATLPDRPGLVLFTDGQESPPISPTHRPTIDAKPGDFRGLLVGTGGLAARPIPKFDPQGNRIGYWKADEVSQTDIYSEGRGGSVSSETLAETDAARGAAAVPAGREHLSALRESYLQQLASETGLGYYRLDSAAGLRRALTQWGVTDPVVVDVDVRWIPATLALVALLGTFVGSHRRRWPRWPINRTPLPARGVGPETFGR